MGAPIVHFEILGVDFQKTKEFYSDMFGWTMQDSPGMNYALVDTNVKMGINGGLGQIDPGKMPYVAIYAQVEDPQAYLDKAVSLGAKVVAPVTVRADEKNKKSTFPTVLGLDRSREFTADLIADAHKQLSIFDEKAEPLRAIADYFLTRQH